MVRDTLNRLTVLNKLEKEIEKSDLSTLTNEQLSNLYKRLHDSFVAYYSILFILYVVYAYSVEGNTSSGAGFGLSLIPLALSGFPAVLILDILPNFIKPTIDSLFGGILIMYIVNTLQWFIIGSFLGLLYGKIKNRV